MTNCNERLYEILNNLVFYACEYEAGKDVDLDAETWQAKQVITSLIKELVAEAKPEVRVFDDGINDATYFQQKIVDQFEQNLLKALEEA